MIDDNARFRCRDDSVYNKSNLCFDLNPLASWITYLPIDIVFTVNTALFAKRPSSSSRAPTADLAVWLHR